MNQHQESIHSIERRLADLDSHELNHIQHVLDALESTKDGTMHYLGKFLGMKETDDGIMMGLGLQNENTYGVVQGGALYTLADVAIGYHVLLKITENEQVYTIELKVNFIKKGTGNYVHAKPRILHWGKRTVVAECSMYDEEEKLIAQALGTFIIVK